MFREHARICEVALAGGARLADLDVAGGRWSWLAWSGPQVKLNWRLPVHESKVNLHVQHERPCIWMA
jgi:hypothetical protein